MWVANVSMGCVAMFKNESIVSIRKKVGLIFVPLHDCKREILIHYERPLALHSTANAAKADELAL